MVLGGLIHSTPKNRCRRYRNVMTAIYLKMMYRQNRRYLMGKLIHTTKETATEECFCLEYFDDGTDNKYIDENKYKVVATREKEITDEEDIKLNLKDYEWRLDVYLKEQD